MSWGESVVQGSVSSGGPKLMSWGGGYGAEVKDHVLGGGGGKGCTRKCVQRGSKINVLGGGGGGGYGCRGTRPCPGGKGLYREVCPEGVQN